MTTPIDIRPLFGLESAPNPIMIPGNREWVTGTPKSNPDYIFQRQLVMDMIIFWNSGDVAAQFIGHMGTGKSSFIREWHARLNLPLYCITASPRMEAQDLIGRYYPTEAGGLKYVRGVMAKAATDGTSVLIDEWNLLEAGESSGTNDLLEGYPTHIPETGELLEPQPGYRVFTAINPKVMGYAGRKTQDGANDDRFSYVKVNYMPPADEIMLVKNLLSHKIKDDGLCDKLAKNFVEVANMVRAAFIGSSDDPGALEVTISTRSLLRWVRDFLHFKGVSQKGYSPLHYALERAKTFKANPSTQIAIHQIVQQVFNEEWKTPDSLVWKAPTV